MAQQTLESTLTRETWLPMTYEEFLALPDDLHAEWVDGEGIIFMPASTRHQDLSLFLASLLSLFVKCFDLGKVLAAPYEVRIRSGRSSREPDILFIANSHLDRLTKQRLEGPADLVIELISAHSVARDRREKFREYEDAGVLEYWIVDSREGKEGAEFFQRTPEGRFRAVTLDAAGRYYSMVLPDFWLDTVWLWQDPLPNALTILATIAPDAVSRAVAGASVSALPNGSES